MQLWFRRKGRNTGGPWKAYRNPHVDFGRVQQLRECHQRASSNLRLLLCAALRDGQNWLFAAPLAINAETTSSWSSLTLKKTPRERFRIDTSMDQNSIHGAHEASTSPSCALQKKAVNKKGCRQRNHGRKSRKDMKGECASAIS